MYICCNLLLYRFLCGTCPGESIAYRRFFQQNCTISHRGSIPRHPRGAWGIMPHAPRGAATFRGIRLYVLCFGGRVSRKAWRSCKQSIDRLWMPHAGPHLQHTHARVCIAMWPALSFHLNVCMVLINNKIYYSNFMFSERWKKAGNCSVCAISYPSHRAECMFFTNTQNIWNCITFCRLVHSLPNKVLHACPN